MIDVGPKERDQTDARVVVVAKMDMISACVKTCGRQGDFWYAFCRCLLEPTDRRSLRRGSVEPIAR